MRSKELLIAVVVAAGLAVALTWPIAPRLGSAARVDSGDGRFSIWNVAWVARALTTDPSSLYRANIFYPDDKALTYSETNLVAGALAVPVWLLTGNAIAAGNFAILSGFVLAALAMYALVRHLTGHIGGSAIAGIVYAFCPYAFSHIPHIQLLMTFGPPLALLCLHRLVETPTMWRGVWLGLALAVQALACGYYGLYGGLAIAWGVIWLGAWSGRWREFPYWRAVSLALVLSIAVVTPFVLPFLDIRTDGFGRSIADARLFSANWTSYFASPLVFHRWILPWLGDWGSWRDVLFPGYVPVVLSIAAMALAVKRTTAMPARAPRYVIGFYLTLAVLAMWASFGPDAGLYRVLYETVPMMSFLRAPARFGVLVTLSLSVIAGIGLAVITTRWHGRRRLALLWLMVGFLVVRRTPGPLALVDAPEAGPVYTRLAMLSPGPVIEFPYFHTSLDRSRHTEYMLMSTLHWMPLINGYSDHIPGDAFDDMRTLGAFPGAKAWQVMTDRHARYVIVHWNRYTTEEAEPILEALEQPDRGLRLLVASPAASLYEVSTWRERAVVETPPAADGGG